MISWYKEEKNVKIHKKNSKHLNCYFWISEMNKESMCVLLHLHKNGMIERSQSQKRKDPIIFSERNPHFIYYSEGSWLDILFSSNHYIHKILYGLCSWASDPLIERF